MTTLSIAKLDIDALADEITRRLAPKVAEMLKAQVHTFPTSARGMTPEYCEGYTEIAKAMNCSDETIRRWVATGSRKLPICGYKTRKHRGVDKLVPICRADDLRKMRENLITPPPIRSLSRKEIQASK